MELSQTKIITEFSNVVGCERCSELDVHRDASFNLPQPGFVGKNYAAHRIILIGQNPGASPDRFSTEDKLYADLLLKLRAAQDVAAYSELYVFLAEFMRRWQVEKYFPLAESGLKLEDIAYFNLVRCRTRANAVPGSNVINACMQHFVSWIEMLSPAVVVCIGKYSYDRISQELKQRGIPCCFINRARDLSNSKRQIDRSNAAAFVKSILSGKPVVKTAKSAPVTVPETPVLKIVKKTENPKVKITLSGDCQSMFRQILKALGFEGDIALTKVLKHKRNRTIPSMYFNSNAEHRIYFTAKECDISRFPGNLWLRVENQMQIKSKDLMPDKINIVPKPGKEEEAFRKLLECKNDVIEFPIAEVKKQIREEKKRHKQEERQARLPEIFDAIIKNLEEIVTLPNGEMCHISRLQSKEGYKGYKMVSHKSEHNQEEK